MKKPSDRNFKTFLCALFIASCVLIYIAPSKPSKLDAPTNFILSIFNGIETYASASEFPYELRHLFAIHWALTPVVIFLFCNAVKTRIPSKGIDDATAFLGIIFSLSLSVIAIDLLGISGIDNPIVYTGKAAAIITLMTQYKPSCAIMSSFLFLALWIFISITTLMTLQLSCSLLNRVSDK